jgi:hypothetical protein
LHVLLFFWAKPRKKSILRPHALSLLHAAHARARMLDRASVGPNTLIYTYIYTIPRRRALIYTSLSYIPIPIHSTLLYPPSLYTSSYLYYPLYPFLLHTYLSILLLCTTYILTCNTASFSFRWCRWYGVLVCTAGILSTTTQQRNTTECFLLVLLLCPHYLPTYNTRTGTPTEWYTFLLVGCGHATCYTLSTYHPLPTGWVVCITYYALPTTYIHYPFLPYVCMSVCTLGVCVGDVLLCTIYLHPPIIHHSMRGYATNEELPSSIGCM